MDRNEQNSADGQDPETKFKQGGWFTIPFIMAAMAGTSLTFGGFQSNLIAYLIEEFNIKSITAAKIFNVVSGCIYIFPVAGAIIADSFLGSYSVIWISCLISSLGMLTLVLTAAIKNLRPPQCENGASFCISPSGSQLAVLYIGLALTSLGLAGTRFTIGTFGADQFVRIVSLLELFSYLYRVIVYIQDSVSWAWGFGISVASNAIGLALFVAGTGFYRRFMPQGSPFAGLARVVVAATRKRKLSVSENIEDYCQGPQDVDAFATPTKNFRFLNRAALKTEQDTGQEGSIRKPWRQCTVKEVEDFKSLIKLLPLWSTAVIVYVPIVIPWSMVVIQALTMDLHIGPHFKIPAGTVPVFIPISNCVTIFLIERLLLPLWDKFTHRTMTMLQRVGIGHVLDVLAMAGLALVEARRLKIVRLTSTQGQDNSVLVPMSVFWLVPSLALSGSGNAFIFPSYASFSYQEFPASLKNTSTAVLGMAIGLSYYVYNALIEVVKKRTDWLLDNLNDGRLDNVYWLVTALACLNFCYFLLCSSMYKYQNVANATDDSVDEE